MAKKKTKKKSTKKMIVRDKKALDRDSALWRKQLRAQLTASEGMDPDVKKVWLEALRSGEYKQGAYTMCRVDSEGAYSFCCLGVLADGAFNTDWYLIEHSFAHRLGSGSYSARLSDVRLKKIGLSEAAQDALVGANDAGLRFSAIADAIEECL